MLLKLVLNRLDAAERKLGEPLDYLRHMARVSLGGFFKFAALPVAGWTNKHLPADVYYTALIAAARYEDCGPCVQTVVNLALGDGVPAGTVRAIVERRLATDDPDLDEVYRFATAVAEGSGQEDDLREAMRARYGEAGLVELSLAIVRGRVYPTLKRGLGYATSCSLVEVRV
jgi:alkylhydroperoxidase family enzyme